MYLLKKLSPSLEAMQLPMMSVPAGGNARVAVASLTMERVLTASAPFRTQSLPQPFQTLKTYALSPSLMAM